jgi:hypothetical protein
MHVLIDFETLGTALTGKIAYAAFGLFDLTTLQSPDEITKKVHSAKLDWSHPQQEHYLADDATLQFWKKQPIEIRQTMLMDPETGKSVSEFLDQFEDALFSDGFSAATDAVWARGTDFDITILYRLYKDLNRVAPFQFHRVRDVRTFLDAVNVMDDVKTRDSFFTGKIAHLNEAKSNHDAVYDVANDIHNLQLAYQALRGSK